MVEYIPQGMQEVRPALNIKRCFCVGTRAANANMMVCARCDGWIHLPKVNTDDKPVHTPRLMRRQHYPYL